MIKSLINTCISFLFFISKQDKKKVVFSSFPDFSDNSFALFIYFLNHKSGYQLIWLVDDVDTHMFRKVVENYSTNLNYSIKKKRSLTGFFHFITAGHVFHTHGIFNSFGTISKHRVINLWHGMPLKKIGLLEDGANKNVIHSNFHLCTSQLYQDILSRAFGVDKKSVLVLGQPRNDLLLETSRSIHDLFDKDMQSKSILWMPTYRKSVVGDIREDGKKNKNVDFFSKRNLEKLNLYCKSIDAVCYIKIHPMDYMTVDEFDSYSNIVIFDNDVLNRAGIHLYSIIGSVDVLLTDFSSIYIDYLLLDKPIGFVFSDFEEYINTRGFIFENLKDFMPGEIISSTEELILFLEDVVVKKMDNFKTQRTDLTRKFHDVESGFSERIYNAFINEPT